MISHFNGWWHFSILADWGTGTNLQRARGPRVLRMYSGSAVVMVRGGGAREYVYVHDAHGFITAHMHQHITYITYNI